MPADNKASLNQKLNGKKTGRWIMYYANGNVRSDGHFKAGKKHGPMTLYFPDGTVKSQGTFHEGLYTGKYTSYHENGAPFRTGLYNDIQGNSGDGRKEGVWRQYSPEGVIEWRVTYRRGKITERIPYPEGKPE